MKKNNSGFSILIGMGLVILITLTSYVILSFIIPFSKSIRGIENSSVSYYLGYSGIEDAMYFLKNRTLLNSETGSTMPITPVGYGFQTYSTGNIIPTLGKGNSEYDKNFNTISKIEPLQLEVGNDYLNSSEVDNLKFIFRVPDFDGDGEEDDETLSGETLPIVYWIISSSSGDDVLYASGSYIEAKDIEKSNCSYSCEWNINDKLGVNLYGSGFTFGNFFENNCEGTNSGCVLKISVINDLKLTSGNEIPYLEYKITGLPDDFPNRYTRIESRGKSYGFQKKLEVNIPQQTVNQAFDFTVFQ